MSNAVLNQAVTNGDVTHAYLVPGQTSALGQVTATSIEQAIEQIGERYLADLRMLSEQFSGFYEMQLSAKDKQIDELRECLAAAELDRDLLTEQINALRDRCATYIADIHEAGEQFNRELKATDLARKPAVA